MSTYLEQLAQIFNGAVWDGDLISKDDRDRLVKDGLVDRSEGYNIITPDGVSAFVFSGGFPRKITIQDNTVRLFARIASRRFAPKPDDGSPDGVFNGAQFSGVVSDILGLPTLDGYVVKMILSDRDWLSRLHGGSHWQIMECS